MKIYNSSECEIGIDEKSTYIIKYKKAFYKLDKGQFIEIFGEEELKFQREIKDSPMIAVIMTFAIISTVVYYLFTEKYVILDKNIIIANVVLFFNIFIHEMGHIIALKLFLPESTVDFGFKMFFIYPSFYVDTSSTYLIPKYKRIAVYLSGNFMNCLYLIICYFVIKNMNEYNYLVVSNIIINFIPIIKSDGYYAFKTLLNQYNYNKTKMKNYVEDTVRGILMFIFLNILSCLNAYL